MSLGMRIKPDVWDQEHFRVIGKSEDVLLMNNKITQVKARKDVFHTDIPIRTGNGRHDQKSLPGQTGVRMMKAMK